MEQPGILGASSSWWTMSPPAATPARAAMTSKSAAAISGELVPMATGPLLLHAALRREGWMGMGMEMDFFLLFFSASVVSCDAEEVGMDSGGGGRVHLPVSQPE